MCVNNDSNNKPIRILQVLTAMNRAGTETMLMNLYRSVDRSRIQFDFAVTTSEKCDYDDEILSMGGKIIRYPKYKVNNHFSYKRWWKDFFINNPEYRIVHGHIGSTASIYLSIAKKYGLYTIAHSHSTGKMNSIRDFFYKVYSYSTRFIADYFIGCSKAALISRYGSNVAKNQNISCVLNNGIDIEKYAYNDEIREEVKLELNICKTNLVIGTVGRFTEAKNPFFIVDILDELKKKNSEFKFVWAGTGELFSQVKEYITKKGLDDNIILLGVRNDINRILQVLNVFILPSLYEGLPVIGVEVQAAGVPLLCSNKVSKEVALSNCVSFLPIDSTTPWVNAILSKSNFQRILEAPFDVANAGYDIRSTASWLMSFYESRCERT